MLLDFSALSARANADGEFALHARFWNAVVKLRVGEASYRLDVRDGKLTDCAPWLGSRRLRPRDRRGRRRMGQPAGSRCREPFYQDLYAATDPPRLFGHRRYGQLLRLLSGRATPRRTDAGGASWLSHASTTRPGAMSTSTSAASAIACISKRAVPRRHSVAVAAHGRRGRTPMASRARRRRVAQTLPDGRVRPAVSRQIGAANERTLVECSVQVDARSFSSAYR